MALALTLAPNRVPLPLSPFVWCQVPLGAVAEVKQKISQVEERIQEPSVRR